MAFKNAVPQWKAKGTKPSEGLIAGGFKAGYKPPASLFNYMFNSYSNILNELLENALNLTQKVEEKASLTDVSSPYNFKGSTTFAALPTSGNAVNDTYYCTDKKCKYTWNGAAWYQSSLNEGDYTEELNKHISKYFAGNDASYALETGDSIIDSDYAIVGNAENSRKISFPAFKEAIAGKAERTKGAAIVQTVQGEEIIVNDSSDDHLRNLKVYGKSTQIKTTGIQLADFRNGTTASGVTATFENDVLIVTGNGSALYQNYGVNITEFYKNNPAKVLSFYCEKFASTSPLDGTLAQLNILKTDGTRMYVGLYTKTGTKAPYTIPDDTSDVSSVSLCIYTTNADTAIANAVTITKPMLKFGTDELPYEPFSGGKASPSPQYPQTIENCENTEVSLLDRNIFGGMALAKKIEANGGTLTETAATVTWACDAMKSNAIYDAFKENTRYTIVLYGKNTANNMIYANIHVEYTDGRVHQLSFPKTGENSYIVYTTEANKTVKGLSHYWHTNGTILLYERCGLFVGVVSLKEFEQYKAKQSLTIPNTLCGIPVSSGGNYTDDKGQEWVCDEVDMERGVYVQRIGKLNTADFTASSINVSSITNPNGKLYLTTFISNIATALWTTRQCVSATDSLLTIGENSCLCRTNSSNSKYMNLYWISQATTATDALAELKAEASNIYYILAQPIETPLTAEQIAAYKALHSNYHNTVITNNNGAGMAAEYNADTKLYIDNKFAELSAALLANL